MNTTISITSNKLSFCLQIKTLQALSECFDQHIGIPFFVIGATSRDFLSILFDSPKPLRATRDLDICLAVPDWDRFDMVSKIMQSHGFRKDPNVKQRFYYDTGDFAEYEIDVVPFGGVSPDEEHIYWPPDMDPMMTVRGFDAVLKQCISVEMVDLDFSFKIPTAGGLFLLKFDAWLDRHTKTDKDAEDMRYLMASYFLPNCTDLKYAGVYELEGEFSDIRAGAYMLAVDICQLVDKKHLEFYHATIREEIAKSEDSDLLRMTMSRQDDTISAFNEIKSAWAAMAEVIEENLK